MPVYVYMTNAISPYKDVMMPLIKAHIATLREKNYRLPFTVTGAANRYRHAAYDELI